MRHVAAASLDSYSDSNTRERRPYEADGIIAATARLLVQRDVSPRRTLDSADMLRVCIACSDLPSAGSAHMLRQCVACWFVLGWRNSRLR
jgi:hypothetical protein